MRTFESGQGDWGLCTTDRGGDIGIDPFIDPYGFELEPMEPDDWAPLPVDTTPAVINLPRRSRLHWLWQRRPRCNLCLFGQIGRLSFTVKPTWQWAGWWHADGIFEIWAGFVSIQVEDRG